MAYADRVLLSREAVTGAPSNVSLTTRLSYSKGSKSVSVYVSVEKVEDGMMSFLPFSSEHFTVLKVARLGAKTLADAATLLASEPLASKLAACKAQTLVNNAANMGLLLK